MTEATEQPAEPDVDVEAIMQEIRAKILAQQAQLPGKGETLVAVDGKRFSPEFYEHLYQANLAHNRMGVDLQVTRMRTPLVGPLLERLRRTVHQLVLFYVNQVAAQQREVNAHLLQALSLLAKEMEDVSPVEQEEGEA